MARARDGNGVSAANRPLGLPDDAFAQKRPVRGLITKSEVRAVSLYKLGLRRNSVVWDVGAGSGSVALEAALIASEGMVYAVERDGECVDMLRHNIANLGPANVVVEAGEAPDALDGLPAPDCVFVGGGGGKLRGHIGMRCVSVERERAHRGEPCGNRARADRAGLPCRARLRCGNDDDKRIARQCAARRHDTAGGTEPGVYRYGNWTRTDRINRPDRQDR